MKYVIGLTDIGVAFIRNFAGSLFIKEATFDKLIITRASSTYFIEVDKYQINDGVITIQWLDRTLHLSQNSWTGATELTAADKARITVTTC